MPVYPMICGVCEYQFELEQSIKLSLPTSCPECGQESLSQDYSVPRDNFMFCRGDAVTIGQTAERNAKRMGKEQTQLKQGVIGAEAEQKAKEARARRPWWRKDSDKPIDITKIKDKTEFIKTGRK